MSIESVMSSNHLILCHPLLLLPSIFPSIKVFSNELALCIRWPKYWSFNFSICPSNECSGLIFFRIDWFDLLAVACWISKQRMWCPPIHQPLQSTAPNTPASSAAPLLCTLKGFRMEKKQDTCLLGSFNGPEPCGTESTIRKWKWERGWYPLVYSEDQ